MGREAQSQVVAIHFQCQSSAADNCRAQSQARNCTYATSFRSYSYCIFNKGTPLDLALVYQRGLPFSLSFFLTLHSLLHCSLRFLRDTLQIYLSLRNISWVQSQVLLDHSGGSTNAGQHAGNTSSVDATATGKRQTIVETLEAPVLKEISVEVFARFLADRNKYENEIV